MSVKESGTFGCLKSGWLGTTVLNLDENSQFLIEVLELCVQGKLAPFDI